MAPPPRVPEHHVLVVRQGGRASGKGLWFSPFKEGQSLIPELVFTPRRFSDSDTLGHRGCKVKGVVGRVGRGGEQLRCGRGSPSVGPFAERKRGAETMRCAACRVWRPRVWCRVGVLGPFLSFVSRSQKWRLGVEGGPWAGMGRDSHTHTPFTPAGPLGFSAAHSGPFLSIHSPGTHGPGPNVPSSPRKHSSHSTV